MVFGLVIDSACAVRQMTCGHKGACLLYQRLDFRYKYHIFAAAAKFGALVAFAIGWYKIRHMNTPLLQEDNDKAEPEETEPLQDKVNLDENATA